MAFAIWKQLPCLTVAAGLHIFSVLLWFSLEFLAIHAFDPDYNLMHNAISDLGIPYDFEDAKHSNRLSRSRQSKLMNINFRALAVFYTMAQYALHYGLTKEMPIVRTKSWRNVRETRMALSLIFVLGLSTVGYIHAGPIEDANGQTVIHLMGAGLAISSGNLNSILSGTLSVPLQTTKAKHYQTISLALGSVGLVALVSTLVASSWVSVALLRGSAYTVFWRGAS